MKTNLKTWMAAFTTAFCVFALTSCDDMQTIDIPGPSISYEFNYSDLRSSTGDLTMVVESDTIYGNDINEFLNSDTATAKYASMVEAATLNDAKLELLGGTFNYSGVDSVEIRYQIVGQSQEIVLCQAKVIDQQSSSLSFTSVKVTKAQAFELIGSDIVVRLYAIYNPALVNCFQPGASYRFTAETTLSVKLSAALDGFGDLLGMQQ